MKKKWYAVNVKTGEICEAMQEMTFKEFLKESGFGKHYVMDCIIGTKQDVLKRLEKC